MSKLPLSTHISNSLTAYGWNRSNVKAQIARCLPKAVLIVNVLIVKKNCKQTFLQLFIFIQSTINKLRNVFTQ